MSPTRLNPTVWTQPSPSAFYQDRKGLGPSSVRLHIGPSGQAGPLSPAAAVNHTITALVALVCKSGLQRGPCRMSLCEVTGVK